MVINLLSDSINDNEEKILLINLIGTLEALKKGNITIDEAEKFLFSPKMINRLKEKQCNVKIVNILERGCELEDIASLLPHSLIKNICELKEQALEVIKEYPVFNKNFWVL